MLGTEQIGFGCAGFGDGGMGRIVGRSMGGSPKIGDPFLAFFFFFWGGGTLKEATWRGP